MNQHTELRKFEGPLDLLLSLIEQNELEITAVSLSAVTEDYIDSLDKIERDVEELHDFVSLGARLVYIKSRAIIPDKQSDYGADEDDEPAEELAAQLQEYRRYKKLSALLQDMYLSDDRLYARKNITQAGKKEAPKQLPKMSADQLTEMYAWLLQQKPKVHAIKRPGQINLKRLKRQLLALLADKPSVSLDEAIVGKEKREVVAHFMAVLELTQEGRLKLKQGGPFKDISYELCQNRN